MNFIFSKEKTHIPKYASGSKPYVIDTDKIFNKVLKKKSKDDLANSVIYLANMILMEEFEFALKKKKTSIFYINSSISLDLIKNIKKLMPSIGIEVKKYFLLDDSEFKKLHKHVDQVIKIK